MLLYVEFRDLYSQLCIIIIFLICQKIFQSHLIIDFLEFSLHLGEQFSLQFFFNCLTHIFKTLPLFFKSLHTNPIIAHTKFKMPHISCKMKHCIQNITNTSQKQTFANTFAVILIPVRFLCVHRELCVVLCKKLFYEIEN